MLEWHRCDCREGVGCQCLVQVGLSLLCSPSVEGTGEGRWQKASVGVGVDGRRRWVFEGLVILVGCGC